MVTSITTATFIRDATIFLRDELLNITDPVSGSRAGNEKFVMTSYPKRDVRYPIITIKNTALSFPVAAGQQSEIHIADVSFEVRVWARNEYEKDGLTQNVLNQLRGFQYDGDGSIQAGLFDFQLLSLVNVDEDGEQAVKSKVMEVGYRFVLGS